MNAYLDELTPCKRFNVDVSINILKKYWQMKKSRLFIEIKLFSTCALTGICRGCSTEAKTNGVMSWISDSCVSNTVLNVCEVDPSWSGVVTIADFSNPEQINQI